MFGSKSGKPDPSSELCAHYQSLFHRYGTTHDAVQWSSVRSQQRRFKVLADVVDQDSRILDVGCGLGDLLGYLRQHHGFVGQYEGVDQVSEFIATARDKYIADTKVQFQISDVTQEPLVGQYDCALSSGLFNNRLHKHTDNWPWLTHTAAQLFEVSQRVAAFNALSAWMTPREQSLFYVDPERLVSWCAKNLTDNLVLRHDYNRDLEAGIPRDFTIYLYK